MTGSLARAGSRLAGVRALIARRMRQSLSESAQISYFVDVDVTDALNHREEFRRNGVAVGIEDVVISAITVAVRDYPDFNAAFADGIFNRNEACDISVAISSPTGLVTPVIRGVEQLSLEQIIERRRDLVSRAMSGSLTVADMKGGTFTISNLGLSRIRHFTPILNYPQVAILGIGRIGEVPKIVDGALAIRKVMGLSLTTDHQVIDGTPCGNFLGNLSERIEKWPGDA